MADEAAPTGETTPERDSGSEAAPATSLRRRRRRGDRRSPVPEPRPGDGAAPAGGDAVETDAAPADRPLRRRVERWRLPQFVASWGVAPTFRVFLFLGAIVGVLAFLLYNEYVIRQFKEQEQGRVELYALLYGLAVSPEIPEGATTRILEKIILNPDISFPVVVTDHRGEILWWKADSGMPPISDRSPAAVAQVRAIVAQMDAVNEPVESYDQSTARGKVLQFGRSVILTDAQGDPVVWDGPDLPASDDTTEEARNAVRSLAVLHGRGAREVQVHPEHASTLLHDGERFAIVDHNFRPVAWGGAGMPGRQDTTAAAGQQLDQAVQGLQLEGSAQSFRIHTEKYIHYAHSALISRISLSAVVSIGALLLFGLVGYMGFRNLRRSEQRSIWVGMAKETAHQLGTPLSSLAGWLELMSSRVEVEEGSPGSEGPGPERGSSGGNGDLQTAAGIAREMQRDMSRLNQIASRFSQIGSVPELRLGDVTDVIEETIAYFRSRGPQFGRHRFATNLAPVPQVPLNSELMGWALENLIKNSMDAVGTGEGVIEVQVRPHPDREAVQVTVSDNGRGIETENLSRVFEPGFSTKKRGWGLGLAFVKRIIEEYHGGRIQIVHSEKGEGTTFEIALPVT